MAQPENVVVYWPISCFDRRKPNPLPVETKFCVLDEERATDAEKAAILALIRRDTASPPPRVAPADKHIVTISHGIHGTSREILRYRHLFCERSSEEFEAIFKAPDRHSPPLSVQSVSLIGEYFEDENGREVTRAEMCAYLADGGPTIVMGEPQSVLQLGPAKPKALDKWTVETANTIAHFFQVVDHIRTSSWMRSPLSMTLVGGEGVVSAAFPLPESAFGVLVLFRQLCSFDSKDNLFNRATGAYLRHVDHPGKTWWVKSERTTFNTVLQRKPPVPFTDLTCSVKDVMDAFLYGARLMHSRPRDASTTQRLRDILSKTPREHLVMAYHSGMKFLLTHALTVYPVIKQDFLHWTAEVGLAKPDLIDIAHLLSSRQLA